MDEESIVLINRWGMSNCHLKCVRDMIKEGMETVHPEEKNQTELHLRKGIGGTSWDRYVQHGM